MTRHAPTSGLGGALAVIFCLGLGAVAWVGSGYLGSNTLALAMTGLIATAYLSGAAELRRFHRATGQLQQALASLPQLALGTQTSQGDTHLGAWLAGLHPSLRTPVRLRIEGERLALPGPALTPYLVGLLVLLGMLGTFVGMVATMQGAVLALQGSTDLATVRDALSAPVQGLGLAFGTSVAGVAASAMLGLMSALCRRQRLAVAQSLDSLSAQHLPNLHHSHQRTQMLQALQALQAQTAPLPQLPQWLEHLQGLAQQAGAQAHASHERLLLGQQQFQHDFQQSSLARMQALGETFAMALQQQVQQALQEGTRLAAATLQPVVASTLAGIDQRSAALQHDMAHHLQQQLQGQAAAFERQQSAWLAQLAQAQTTQQDLASAADQLRLAQWSTQLKASSQALVQTWEQAWQTWEAAAQTARAAASEAAQAQQVQICSTLTQTAQALQVQAGAQARDTLAELSRLAASAALAPQAAAELVHTLRQKLSDSLAQDQRQLTERDALLQRLTALLDSLQQHSDAQRRDTEAALATAAQQLQQASTRLETRASADTATLAAAAEGMHASAVELSTSAVDMASLAEGFGAAVQLFGSSSSALGAQLQQIEAALSRSTARSDEQLAYYVAQARELIELSISSQQHIVQDLRQLAQPARPSPARVGEPA